MGLDVMERCVIAFWLAVLFLALIVMVVIEFGKWFDNFMRTWKLGT